MPPQTRRQLRQGQTLNFQSNDTKTNVSMKPTRRLSKSSKNADAVSSKKNPDQEKPKHTRGKRVTERERAKLKMGVHDQGKCIDGQIEFGKSREEYHREWMSYLEPYLYEFVGHASSDDRVSSDNESSSSESSFWSDARAFGIARSDYEEKDIKSDEDQSTEIDPKTKQTSN